jgi:hypothetical protein
LGKDAPISLWKYESEARGDLMMSVGTIAHERRGAAGAEAVEVEAAVATVVWVAPSVPC